MTVTPAAISALRDRRYHRTPEGRVHTEAAARAFVDEVGFCFLFGERGLEIPTLWGAICGADRPVPRHHDDADLGRAWNWKDSLPARGEVFYGKLLRAKPTLVSLELLPAFYALSPNYGDVEDYLQQYEEGLLTIEARNIYQALQDEGPLPTSRLRQIAGLQGGGPVARRFDSALTELQTQLKIAKTGISDANRWGYAYVYDLFLRALPRDARAGARYLDRQRHGDAVIASPAQHRGRTRVGAAAVVRLGRLGDGPPAGKARRRRGHRDGRAAWWTSDQRLVVATATLRELEALA